MKGMIELSTEEILTINGGVSFAYRAGQVCAVLWDIIDPAAGLTHRGGITAICDWFDL